MTECPAAVSSSASSAAPCRGVTVAVGQTLKGLPTRNVRSSGPPSSGARANPGPFAPGPSGVHTQPPPGSMQARRPAGSRTNAHRDPEPAIAESGGTTMLRATGGSPATSARPSCACADATPSSRTESHVVGPAAATASARLGSSRADQVPAAVRTVAETGADTPGGRARKSSCRPDNVTVRPKSTRRVGDASVLSATQAVPGEPSTAA